MELWRYSIADDISIARAVASSKHFMNNPDPPHNTLSDLMTDPTHPDRLYKELLKEIRSNHRDENRKVVRGPSPAAIYRHLNDMIDLKRANQASSVWEDASRTQKDLLSNYMTDIVNRMKSSVKHKQHASHNGSSPSSVPSSSSSSSLSHAIKGIPRKRSVEEAEITEKHAKRVENELSLSSSSSSSFVPSNPAPRPGSSSNEHSSVPSPIVFSGGIHMDKQTGELYIPPVKDSCSIGVTFDRIDVLRTFLCREEEILKEQMRRLRE